MGLRSCGNRLGELMSCIFDENDPSRLISIEFYGYLRSATFAGNTAQFTLAYYGEPAEDPVLHFLQIDFENPGFTEADLREIEIEETSEIRIEENRALIYCDLIEEPHVFEAQRANMKLVSPPTDFYMEWLERLGKGRAQNQEQLRVLRHKLNRAQSFLNKAKDRAERRAEFKSEADMIHELSALKGALTFLEEE